MKIKNIYWLLTILLLPSLGSCVKDAPAAGEDRWSEGALLRISVDRGLMTRLAEITDTDQMGSSVAEDDKDYGLKNIGLYVYYKSDYQAGIVDRPYIRNMECTVENGMLVPVTSGTDPDEGKIYIYDEMTLVAFYPYNSEMSLPENHFTDVEMEENYPITRNEYSDQYYIPYRAETTTDPTIAYYTQLKFYPKHTYKIELVIVSDDLDVLPDPSSIEILPDIDPIDSDVTQDGRRAAWIDKQFSQNNRGGGSHVRQYTAYVWTDRMGDNSFALGEVLMRSDKLTLISSQEVTVDEDRVYRYGFNMSTGEIFIPTSTALVHDIPSLAAVGGNDYSYYQVCDIDMSEEYDWEPLNKIGGRFDGGGHKIINLTVNTFESKGGLFGQIQGNTTICNVNLIDPSITVVNTSDTCYVGAICGSVNSALSDEDKLKYIGNLPEDLSPVVREALIQELLKDILNSQSNIVACRVENPTIDVRGLAPRVGTICGQAGSSDAEGDYRAVIWDTYSLGGSIKVNEGNPEENEDGYVGGFAGLSNGDILRSFATISDIVFRKEVAVDDGNGNVTMEPVDSYTGFTTIGNYIGTTGRRVYDCFSVLADNNASLMPASWPGGWVTYTSKWPVMTIGWMEDTANSFWWDLGSAPENYPILQWERR